MSLNDKLKDEIRQGALLQKVPDDEFRRREESKKKRAEELKKIAENLANVK